MLTTGSYPLTWALVFATPLLIWLAVVAGLRTMTRDGRIDLKINLLAIAGALLSYVSLLTAWEVVERGFDWSISAPYSLFLLFTYPISVVTPLASIGQVGVLIYTALYANVEGANIEPLYGYAIAWIAVGFMVAGMIMPRGPLRKCAAKPAFVETVLTLTAKREG